MSKIPLQLFIIFGMELSADGKSLGVVNIERDFPGRFFISPAVCYGYGSFVNDP